MKVYRHELAIINNNLEIWCYDDHKNIIGKLLIERHRLISVINSLYEYVDKLPKLEPDAPWYKPKTKEEIQEIQDRDVFTKAKIPWE